MAVERYTTDVNLTRGTNRGTGAGVVGVSFESGEGVLSAEERVANGESLRGGLGSIDISVLIGGEEEVKGV